jgi:hypothetical protein
MKPTLLPAALVAAAGFALAPGHARAQSSTHVSVNTGTDLYLGFEESGNGNNLIVDLGADTLFLDATAAFTVQFGAIPAGQTGAGTAVYSLSADLSSNFGSWASSSGATALKWGVVGDDENGPNTLLFVSRDSLNPNVPINASYNNIGIYADDVDSLGGTLSTDFSTVNSTEAASVPATATTGQPNSWSSFNPYTNAFGTGLDIEQSPGDGPLSTLNLFEEIPNENGGGAATDVGFFTLASNGDLTFTPASVPEPSTWLSLIGGAFFLGFLRRRRGLRAS